MAPRIYFDHASGTPPCRAAIEAMRPFTDGAHFANATSLHAEGAFCFAAIERAREHVARMLGARSDEIVFTSCGTEAVNLAIKGLAAATLAPSHGVSPAPDARPVVTSVAEPLAIVNALNSLERVGAAADRVPVDAAGVVDVAAIRERLARPAAFVVTHHASRETGVAQPVEQIAAAARAACVPLVCDATASAGLLALDVANLGADLVAISAHTFGGPQGAGALWIRRGVRIRPMIDGGTEEFGLRAGTVNVAAIAGMGAAAEEAHGDMAIRAARLHDLAAALRDGLLRVCPTARVSSPIRGGIPGYVHAAFRGLDGEALVALLDGEGVAASTGSPCATGTGKPSHVLLAMGIPAEEARGTLLLTLGASNTRDDIDRFLEILPRSIARLRSIADRDNRG
ncbi:MAG: cysteine desulfurase family protein [bacterium]